MSTPQTIVERIHSRARELKEKRPPDPAAVADYLNTPAGQNDYEAYRRAMIDQWENPPKVTPAAAPVEKSAGEEILQEVLDEIDGRVDLVMKRAGGDRAKALSAVFKADPELYRKYVLATTGRKE
jgi:hypothetical protein